MKCPVCNSETCVESTEKYDTVVRRCRKCRVCGWRFNTCEEILTEKQAQCLLNPSLLHV